MVQIADNIGQLTAGPQAEVFPRHTDGQTALCKRAVETFDNCLISVSFSATAANVRFVVFDFFRYTPPGSICSI